MIRSMKNLKYLLIAVVMLTIASCKKDEYYVYSDVARIQFGPDISRIYTTTFNLADTLKGSTFYYDADDVLTDTTFYDIYAIGGTSDKDRNFKLEQKEVTGVTNAVAGKHYVAFNDAAVAKYYVIKAGTIHTRVPVITKRDPELKTSTVILKFDVVENEHFKAGERTNLWRKLEITDRLTKPVAWSSGFGVYSTVKHAFMIEVTGQRWDQVFITELAIDLRDYYLTTIKEALINYNNAHPANPMKDENEQLVVFP